MTEPEHSVGEPVREKPDTWRDLRRSMALFVMVLFWLMLVAAGTTVWLYATRDTDVHPEPFGLFRFMSVAVALGVASYAGVQVLRAKETAQSKRYGRIMWIAFGVAVVLIVVTGVIGDRIR